MKQGLIHLYYGDGKGKTTAAMGLATRAAGAGCKVVIVQFMKNGRSSELAVLSALDNVQATVADIPVKFSFNMSDDEKAAACKANSELLRGFMYPDCDLLVLDEAINAYRLGTMDKQLLKDFVTGKPKDLELVLTGRKPEQFFIDHADYATEMVMRKHPYTQGVKARRGVEF